jgi:PKD repeat protein
MFYKKWFGAKKYNSHILIILFLICTTFLYSQTSIEVAPGESIQINREHMISILPITHVTIDVFGEDSIYVAGSVDSFRIESGTLKIRTYYSLYVTPSAPLRELSVQVMLAYRAADVLTQYINEDFLINTTVLPSIIANFSADLQEGPAPLSVYFNNESTGNIFGYFWEFGDDSTSNDKDPQHTYLEPGIYSVSLTVFNFNVQNIKIKQDYINVHEVTGLKNVSIKVQEVNLNQNYPNPFNPVTMISYTLKNKDNVKLIVFDITGHVIKTLVNKVQDSGKYAVSFDGSDLASGIYVYKLRVGLFEQTRRMILLR